MSPEHDLKEVAAALEPVLEPFGFQFVLEQSGTSSGGSFASGFFVRGSLKIGLICRAAIGEVVYEHGERSMGHSEFMKEIGHGGDCQFQFDEVSMEGVSRTGGDPVAAIAYDITHFASGFLGGNPKEFLALLNRVHDRRMARFGINSG